MLGYRLLHGFSVSDNFFCPNHEKWNENGVTVAIHFMRSCSCNLLDCLSIIYRFFCPIEKIRTWFGLYRSRQLLNKKMSMNWFSGIVTLPVFCQKFGYLFTVLVIIIRVSSFWYMVIFWMVREFIFSGQKNCYGKNSENGNVNGNYFSNVVFKTIEVSFGRFGY